MAKRSSLEVPASFKRLEQINILTFALRQICIFFLGICCFVDGVKMLGSDADYKSVSECI